MCELWNSMGKRSVARNMRVMWHADNGDARYKLFEEPWSKLYGVFKNINNNGQICGVDKG